MSDGTLHTLSAERIAVPNTYDPTRRAGSGGQRYFSDIQYPSETQRPAVLASNAAQAVGLAALNAQNPARQARPSTQSMSDEQIRAYFDGILKNPKLNTERKQIEQSVGAMNRYNISPQRLSEATGRPLADINRSMSPQYLPYGEAAAQAPDIQSVINKLLSRAALTPYGTGPQNYASGGIASIPHNGYYLGGATDGMADNIPANINGTEEAALSDGEFVIPADVVSHLGNGNSGAGAQVLHSMMDRIRKARTGRTEQGRQINPNKFAPA